MFFRRKKKVEQQETGQENLRMRYRRVPGKNHALSVQLNRPSGDPIQGEVVDVSAGGTAILFTHDRDPVLQAEQVVVLTFSSLVHGGEIVVHARVARIHPFADSGRRYGFEFVGVEALFEQLDSFYFNFFNRRRVVRVRPALDTKIKVRIGWGDEHMDALANDVSARGLGIMLNNTSTSRLDGMVDLVLSFALPKSPLEIECPGAITHRTELSKGRLIGVGFTTVDMPDFLPIHSELKTYVDKREKDIARWDSAFE
jgi:c-di-GMP-binding flagellar brake protein YcgR